MIKFILLVAILFGGAKLAFDKFPSLKQNVLEIVNPSVKEGRLLGELDGNLSKVKDELSKISTNNPETAQTGLRIINESKNILAQAREINDKDSGLIKNTIGKVVGNILGVTSPSINTQPQDQAICNQPI